METRFCWLINGHADFIAVSVDWQNAFPDVIWKFSKAHHATRRRCSVEEPNFPLLHNLDLTRKREIVAGHLAVHDTEEWDQQGYNMWEIIIGMRNCCHHNPQVVVFFPKLFKTIIVTIIIPILLYLRRFWKIPFNIMSI